MEVRPAAARCRLIPGAESRPSYRLPPPSSGPQQTTLRHVTIRRSDGCQQPRTVYVVEVVEPEPDHNTGVRGLLVLREHSWARSRYHEEMKQLPTAQWLERAKAIQAAGESGRGGKKLDKDIERQEDLISELRDFEDKLRRAANLHLEPDLNDGVVLNIALLHELVPWKEAKSYWQELREGEYEWS